MHSTPPSHAGLPWSPGPPRPSCCRRLGRNEETLKKLAPFPLTIRPLRQWTSEMGLLPGISLWHRQKAKALCQPGMSLEKRIRPHSFSSWSGHLHGETGAELVMGRTESTEILGFMRRERSPSSWKLDEVSCQVEHKKPAQLRTNCLNPLPFPAVNPQFSGNFSRKPIQ